MAFNSPEKIIKIARETGKEKVNLPFLSTLTLGFLAGAYIGFGFLLYIRITAGLPLQLGEAFLGVIGAAFFPLGLILVVIAGGELVTGNMMAVTVARLYGKITSWQIAKNWTII